jgi:O-acetylhomoserine (thiol)-lyase
MSQAPSPTAPAATPPPLPAWQPDTVVLHAGYDGLEHQRSAAVPIYQTSSFLFEDAQQGAELFDLVQEGHIYARTGNPTQTVLEQRIAQLEGGTAALAVASGMAAIDIALATLAEAGDHVVLASTLYGGSHNLLVHVLKGRGIASTVVDRGDSQALHAAITPQTKAVFLESVGNPSGDVADLGAIAALAHARGVAVVVDNTCATPLLIQPFAHGADVVVHSATKYIGGHGTVIGGLIVDGGRFDWNAQQARYPRLTRPDPAFHQVVFSERYPDAPLVARARCVMLRNAGATLAAHSAFLLLQGLETLALRMERISSNTRRVLEWLQTQPLVTRIHHVGHPNHPDHAHAQRYLRGGLLPGLLSFELRGARTAAQRFYDALQLFQRLVNIGDSKSLAAIPAETTHHLLSDAELARAGIAPGLVRLSIGIEHPDDLLADLRQALYHAATAPSAEVSHAQPQGNPEASDVFQESL